MVQVIGYRNVDFKGQDGDSVSGVSIYVTESIEKNGEGYATDKIFLSTAKIADLGYKPQLGDRLEVQYNRYGKVAAVVKQK